METIQLIVSSVLSASFSGGLVYILTLKIQRKKMSGEANLAEAEAEAQGIKNVESQLDIYIRMMSNLKTEIQTSVNEVKELKEGVAELRSTLYEVVEICETHNEVKEIRVKVREKMVKIRPIAIACLLLLLTGCASVKNKSKTESSYIDTTKVAYWESIQKTQFGYLFTRSRAVTITDFEMSRNPVTGELESTPKQEKTTVDTETTETRVSKSDSTASASAQNGITDTESTKETSIKRPIVGLVSLISIFTAFLFFIVLKFRQKV